VLSAILSHRDYLKESGLWQQRDRERLRAEVTHLLNAALLQRWQRTVSQEKFEATLERVFSREISPGAAIDVLVNRENHL